MDTILPLLATLFLLIALGFLVKRIGLVGEQGRKNLTDLVIYVILPCNIVNAFASGADRSRLRLYLVTFAAALGIQGFSLLYGRLVFRRQPEGKRKCLQYGTVCSNGGFIGNPLAEGLWGMEGLAMASVYLIPLRVMIWSAGLAIFSGAQDFRQLLRRVLTHPCILACEAGIVLMLTGIRLPAFLMTPVRSIGQCNTALSMMAVGMILEQIDLRSFLDRDVLRFSLHRLILIPGLCWLVLKLLGVDSTVTALSVLMTAMPAGATTSILAAKYQMEPEFAAKMVIVSTLLSLPTILLWSMVL